MTDSPESDTPPAADAPGDGVRIGFDLGGTKMYACAFDADYKLLGKDRRKTKGHLGSEAGVDRMIATIQDCLDDAGVTAQQVIGIGVGAPGVTDLDKGVLLNTANLGWKDVPLTKLLGEAFDCPVTLCNDVDAGVYGEWKFGAGKEKRCVLGVFPGTGIGGGLVYEGAIFRGAKMSCMEIGHMPVDPLGPRSGLGQRGTLEAVASKLTIAGQAALAAYRGQAPHLMKNTGTDLTDIRSGALSESAEKDPAVRRILLDAAEIIGTTIGGVVNLLAPDVVVLGGGLVEAMPKLLVPAVKKAALAAVMPAFRGAFDVVPAELGDEAAVMGAAAWQQRQADSGKG
ncbi:ROK family protein [Alienimonas californiensis]|uniref:N-acetylglucosamine repressor n=1 Tax=Alienimonas californiensis TaxID=2527989 RepID=A0A517P708_9PLAN|nr:ROK family protein [Alienimonas californiensis]QDT15160.1 N-acetylglucosamine repressor [Alienimonas californiensis]